MKIKLRLQLKLKIKGTNFLPKLIAIALIFSSAFSQDLYAETGQPVREPLTFKNFYRKVLAYYPKLKQQNANVNLAIANKLTAVSGYLPRLQGVTSLTNGNDPVYVFGSLLRENRFTADNFALSSLNTPDPHTTYNASILGQFPIFDAFQTINRVRSAKLKVDSARDEESFTKMEALLVSVEAYLRAIAIDKLLANVEEVSQASEGDIKQAQDLKTKGLILGADFYAAKVMYGNINQLKNQLIQEKQAAHILLNILMGEEPLNPITIQGSLAEDVKDTQELKNWLEAAYKSRPDFAALGKTIKAQEFEVSREKATILPRVDSFGEARQDANSFRFDGGESYIVGLKAQMDLFDPAYSSRVKASKETLKKLQYDNVILKDRITKDLTDEYAHYEASWDNFPVISAMLDDAKQAMELTLPLYHEGRKSIADLLQIRDSYLNVVRQYYTLTIDTRTSWTRLLYLSGQLDETKLAEIEKRLTNE